MISHLLTISHNCYTLCFLSGDGKLNDAEQAMRDMDKSNRGHLTNDKVYNMMQAQLEVQKELFKTRRIMFV